MEEAIHLAATNAESVAYPRVPKKSFQHGVATLLAPRKHEYRKLALTGVADVVLKWWLRFAIR